jgi:hypothetical protein
MEIIININIDSFASLTIIIDIPSYCYYLSCLLEPYNFILLNYLRIVAFKFIILHHFLPFKIKKMKYKNYSYILELRIFQCTFFIKKKLNCHFFILSFFLK